MHPIAEIDGPRGLRLYIQPTYCVLMPERGDYKRTMTDKQKENMKNLKDNQRKKGLSAKAVRRLSNAINWLLVSAKNKFVFDKQSNKRFFFKVNFVTLTLPSTDHGITDEFFKKTLLHNFINTCRLSFGLKNYIWKVEAQENGNIHAHFTTDTFIHYKDLRRVWNRILSKNGLLDSYTSKHSNLSFDDYCNLYNSAGKKSIAALKKSFNEGVECGWSNPNSTDVHAVYKVDDLAAYMAKYMCKEDEDRRQIKGRLWGCSYNLSSENKCSLHIPPDDPDKVMETLFNPEIEYKPILEKSAIPFAGKKIGELFFIKAKQWGTVIKGALNDVYNQHRFLIRHGIDVLGLNSNITPSVPEPVSAPPPPSDFNFGLQLECPF
jgi:hypothetical protein